MRPTSVMGASKRVTELVVQELDRRHSTRYVAVRFANVMGSAGSMIRSSARTPPLLGGKEPLINKGSNYAMRWRGLIA